MFSGVDQNKRLDCTSSLENGKYCLMTYHFREC